jgi:hypothetical protein
MRHDHRSSTVAVKEPLRCFESRRGDTQTIAMMRGPVIPAPASDQIADVTAQTTAIIAQPATTMMSNCPFIASKVAPIRKVSPGSRKPNDSVNNTANNALYVLRQIRMRCCNKAVHSWFIAAVRSRRGCDYPPQKLTSRRALPQSKLKKDTWQKLPMRIQLTRRLLTCHEVLPVY